MSKFRIFILILPLIISLFVIFEQSKLRSDLYYTSLEVIKENKEVNNLIGNITSFGYILSGNINETQNSGTLKFKVYGSIDSAQVFIILNKRNNIWEINNIALVTSTTDVIIDIN